MLDFININTDQMIPRISGDALATKGFEMGSIMMQCDYLPKEDRNFIITLAK
jgi:hypothetical protein